MEARFHFFTQYLMGILSSFIDSLKNNYGRHRKKLFILMKFSIILMLSILIFPSLKTEPVPNGINEAMDLNAENKTYNEALSREFTLKKMTPKDLPDILWEMPRNIPYGEIVCFQNKGTHLEYNNKTDYENVIVFISIKGKQPEVVRLKESICKYLPGEEDQFQWSFNFSIIFPAMFYPEPKKVWINETHYILQRGSIKPYLDVSSYRDISPIGNSIKFSMLFLSVGTLFWAWSRTIAWIRE